MAVIALKCFSVKEKNNFWTEDFHLASYEHMHKCCCCVHAKSMWGKKKMLKGGWVQKCNCTYLVHINSNEHAPLSLQAGGKATSPAPFERVASAFTAVSDRNVHHLSDVVIPRGRSYRDLYLLNFMPEKGIDGIRMILNNILIEMPWRPCGIAACKWAQMLIMVHN